MKKKKTFIEFKDESIPLAVFLYLMQYLKIVKIDGKTVYRHNGKFIAMESIKEILELFPEEERWAINDQIGAYIDEVIYKISYWHGSGSFFMRIYYKLGKKKVE